MYTEIGVDTEGGGLDHRKSGGCKLVQVANKDGHVLLIKNPDWDSSYLKSILTNQQTTITYHHAYYDLRMIYARMGILATGRNYECTKTLRKILHPTDPAGLSASLRMVLGIHISKDEQQSNWDAKKLTRKQQEYAAADAIHLIPLKDELRKELSEKSRRIYTIALEAIKRKAVLEVEGYTDLLSYEKEKGDKALKNRAWWQHLRHSKEMR